jgi:hypothetical protein
MSRNLYIEESSKFLPKLISLLLLNYCPGSKSPNQSTSLLQICVKILAEILVLTAASMKMVVCWDEVPCCLV